MSILSLIVEISRIPSFEYSCSKQEQDNATSQFVSQISMFEQAGEQTHRDEYG